PDPIPNSAVKHSLADGSGCIASARVGCRQFFPKAEMLHRVSAFLLGKAVVSTNFSRTCAKSWLGGQTRNQYSSRGRGQWSAGACSKQFHGSRVTFPAVGLARQAGPVRLLFGRGSNASL